MIHSWWPRGTVGEAPRPRLRQRWHAWYGKSPIWDLKWRQTEAVYFYGRASGVPPPTHIGVGGTSILVEDRIMYLGLLLDDKWTFGHHFNAPAPKVERVSAALGRFLPNLGSPDGRVRRLYVATVNSVALYGAPMWAANLAAMRRAKDMFRRIQRCMAARVVRAYRTVSHAAVTVLAGWPPLEFLAAMTPKYIGESEKSGWLQEVSCPREQKRSSGSKPGGQS